ncbi:hypothetical protein HUT18_32085 [Streptomyces sp. NA04227]|uniref:hypothetical protein n=1 Tax=Streptomyces sp. NA04227 TaxID=2742136 RepID=UPI001590ED35|nr:hypothetical protein [Streptomyces sp. NA04227]QKW10363.1 hypothetical protein HUT18_32085 [Streptomyces sp. NA04227]
MTGIRMRSVFRRGFAWHWAVAALSFTVLSVLRVVDGQGRTAAGFAALAAVAFALTAFRTRTARTGDGPERAPAAAAVAGGEAERLRRTHDVYRSRLSGWRAIGVAAVLMGAVGIAFFPLLTLVAAPAALTAVLKQRRYARGHRALAAELGRRGVAVAA